MIIEKLKRYIFCFFKVILPRPVKNKLIYFGRSAGIITGKTKDYEIWLIIQLMLHLIKPKTLIEFGSGRSTNYLGEYSFKHSADLISFEQYLFYTCKINLGMKLLFLPWGFVKHIPLKNGWYDVSRVKKLLSKVNNIDFLFYDGPARITSEDRSSAAFYEYVVPKMRAVKMVVVDDVNRDQEDRVASYLTNEFGLKRFNLKSVNDNILAILLSKDCLKAVDELPASLRDLLKEVK